MNGIHIPRDSLPPPTTTSPPLDILGVSHPSLGPKDPLRGGSGDSGVGVAG